MPRLTVLMPTYNVAPWVEEAVQSVLRQTYRDFMLLVIDDCSTDHTVDVVRTINDPRIRLVQNEHNLGLADNLNRGLSLIDTEYVARMDGDDIAEPDWLEREVAVLDSRPEVGVCGGGGVRFGAVTSTIRFPEEHDDIVANMLFECSIVVPTFRMSLYREHGLRYHSDAFPAEDYRFWADAVAVTQLHNIAEPLFRYRMHERQICTSRREEQRDRVVEVRRCMLRYLNGKITPADENYFIDDYLRPIASKADWRQRCRFARHLLELNQERFYNPDVLRRHLRRKLRQTLYYTVTERFFAEGYSLKDYLHYLFSGLALHAGWHYELRFLAKSLLRRRT